MSLDLSAEGLKADLLKKLMSEKLSFSPAWLLKNQEGEGSLAHSEQYGIFRAH